MLPRAYVYERKAKADGAPEDRLIIGRRRLEELDSEDGITLIDDGILRERGGSRGRDGKSGFWTTRLPAPGAAQT
jgi:hypothetical protein